MSLVERAKAKFRQARLERKQMGAARADIRKKARAVHLQELREQEFKFARASAKHKVQRKHDIAFKRGKSQGFMGGAGAIADALTPSAPRGKGKSRGASTPSFEVFGGGGFGNMPDIMGGGKGKKGKGGSILDIGI